MPDFRSAPQASLIPCAVLVALGLLGACAPPARSTGGGGTGNAAGRTCSGAGTNGTGRGGSTGLSGTSGTAARGGSSGNPPPRGPTPAAGGVSFPFPQNRSLAGCSSPNGYLNADVMAAYQQ